MTCYLCKGESFIEREGIVRDKPGLKILECSHCGLVTLDSHEHIDANFYENSGMHTESMTPTNEWLRQLDRDDVRRFNYLKEAITNKDVLDFGCGPGSFMLKAKKAVKSINGVELETRLVPHFKTNELDVFRSIEEIPKDMKFDIITAFHVVEHLKDPILILKQLSEKLNPGGQIVFEIPSGSDALLTLYKCKPFSEFTYWSCHLFLFNASTVKMLADKADLKINYIDHVQRYPLSNHLYWLTNGKPGGHSKWSFLDTPELVNAYQSRLSSLGLTDTIIASFGV